MTAAKSFKDLIVWRKAHALVLDVYRMTKCFPKEELFGLTSQMRRAMVSVAANVVEGFKKRGKADKLRFYNIAQGSLEEVRYYLLLAQDLGYCSTDKSMRELEEVSRLLESYSTAVRATAPQSY